MDGFLVKFDGVNMTHIVGKECIGVKSGECVDVCPVVPNCFHDAGDQFVINPSECIDCGACFAVCPVSAIFTDFDGELTDEQLQFKEKNEKRVKEILESK